MKYKKWIVFAFSQYYPSGGLGDIVGSFDELDDAYKCMRETNNDYAEIVDRDTWEIYDSIG